MHGFALARRAGELESPIGRATKPGAALKRITTGKDSNPDAREREPPDRAPDPIAQHPAHDLPMPDLARIRPRRPFSSEHRIKQDRPRSRHARHRY